MMIHLLMYVLPCKQYKPTHQNFFVINDGELVFDFSHDQRKDDVLFYSPFSLLHSFENPIRGMKWRVRRTKSSSWQWPLVCWWVALPLLLKYLYTHTHTNETLEKLGSPEGEHYCRFIWDCPSGVLDIYMLAWVLSSMYNCCSCVEIWKFWRAATSIRLETDKQVCGLLLFYHQNHWW